MNTDDFQNEPIDNAMDTSDTNSRSDSFASIDSYNNDQDSECDDDNDSLYDDFNDLNFVCDEFNLDSNSEV